MYVYIYFFSRIFLIYARIHNMYCISYLFICIKKDIHFSIILLLLSTDHNSYYRTAHNLFCKINRRIGRFRQQLKIQHTTYTWYDDGGEWKIWKIWKIDWEKWMCNRVEDNYDISLKYHLVWCINIARFLN